MEANVDVIRHWDDVVFENRNKRYGAYLLRRAYAYRLMAGLGFTVSLISLVLYVQREPSGGTIRRQAIPPLSGPGVIIQFPPPIERNKPAESIIETPKNNTQSSSLLVTSEEVVDDVELTALTDFFSDDALGFGESGTFDGTGTFSLPEPEVVIKPTVVDIAEIMPQYEGGMESMMKFIQKKIRYPRVPRELGIQGTVYVRFVVNGDGSVSDVEIIRGVHPDYDEEAVRVISMLPAWKGGSHNGRPVAVRMVLPMKFNLQK